MQVCARQAALSRTRRHKTCVFPHLPGICFRSHTRLRDGSQKGERQRETWVCYLWFRVVGGCLTLICQGLVVGDQGRARRGSGTKSTLLIVMPNKKKQVLIYRRENRLLFSLAKGKTQKYKEKSVISQCKMKKCIENSEIQGKAISEIVKVALIPGR